jgi:hypothetical protein
VVSWLEQVFNYCERGVDPSFWAEPVNAVTNGAFLAAAAVAAARLRRMERSTVVKAAGERMALWLLVGMVAAIGIGSFLFHTFATRWALIADVAPITVFMLGYLAFALRAFLGLGWLATGAILAAFLYAGSLASSVTCNGEPCLNGSLGYLPALVSLLIVGLAAEWRGSRAGRLLLVAGGVFFVSALFRTIDREVCEATHLLGQQRGTHALWHVLNGTTLYLLLKAAIERRAQLD